MNATPLLPFVLVANGLAVAFSLSFFVIILWYDLKRTTNQFLAVFLGFLVLWNLGYLLGEIAQIITRDLLFSRLMLGVTSIGITGVSVAFYALITVLTNLKTRYFSLFVALSLAVIVILNFIPLVQRDNLSLRDLPTFLFVFYDSAGLYLIWYYRRTISSSLITIGGFLFVVGQGSLLLNEALNIHPISVAISSFGALCICVSFLQKELIFPLLNRNKQLETMHEVSLAITTRIATDELLNEIAERSVAWAGADAAGIYLIHPNGYELVSIFQLPDLFLGTYDTALDSIPRWTIESNKSLLIENYSRDWKGEPLFQGISDAFGSIISTPMTFDNKPIGVLLVIANRQGKLFQNDDVRLLELLASQAAVAITHDVFISNQLELDRIKSEMVRMTSHDLKNPLQAATANLDLLKDDLKTQNITDPEILLSVSNVERQLYKMQRIIGGILDLERVRLGVVLKDVCDLEKIILSAIEEVLDAAKEKNIHVAFVKKEHQLFLGDKNQLERAIVNLLDNAIKFTPKEGIVSISLNTENKTVAIAVTDNGVGIPAEIHEQIFDRFFRGNQQGVESVRGSGLGLSLVKAVVESHRGKIWVESQLGSGATFHVLIPITENNHLAKEYENEDG